MGKIQEKRRGRVLGMLLARRGQSGEKEGGGQAGRAGTQAGAEEKSPVGQAGAVEKGRRNRAGGRALRAAAVLAALALLGASPAPEGRERISRGEVLARAPGRLVEQGEERLCFEEGERPLYPLFL